MSGVWAATVLVPRNQPLLGCINLSGMHRHLGRCLGVERSWDTIRNHVCVCGPATAMGYGKVHGSWILLPPKGLHRVVPSPHRPQHVALGRTGCALASCSTQESRSKPFPHMPCDGMDEGKLTLHNCCRKDSWP